MAAAQNGSHGSVGRCLVLHPVLRAASGEPGEAVRSPEGRLDEATGLARAIALEVVHAEVVRVARWRPSTLLGSGAVETLRARIEESAVTVAIVDAAVSPVQQRNLERAWKCKVIDRTGLILEI